MPCPPWVHNERTVEIPWLAQQLAQRPPSVLLDVGSADSFYWPELRATGAACTLFDVRPFQPLYGAPHDTYTLVVAPQLPASWQACFDAVVCISIIDHVGLDAYGQAADPAALSAFVADLTRVTAPGGHLYVTTPAGRDRWTTHPGGGQRVFSQRSLLDLFVPADWQLEELAQWRYDGQVYQPDQAIDDAGYLNDKAEAVLALTLERLDNGLSAW
jgi:SAM-dependent methyltransferase